MASSAGSPDNDGENFDSTESAAAAARNSCSVDSPGIGSPNTAPAGTASADTDGCASSTYSDSIFPADTVLASTDARVGSPDVQVTDPAQALRLLSATLDFLAHANPAEWAEGVQADCLRGLAVAESRQTAAHARILSAFAVPGGGMAGDGHRSPRVWLTWQCAATRRAASYRVSWMHRLTGHPVIAAALAGGSLSPSWA
ncbi:MAG TPA: hypothetical protein VGH53_20390, partial [Streptosporangiaceae bacterium]